MRSTVVLSGCLGMAAGLLALTAAPTDQAGAAQGWKAVKGQVQSANPTFRTKMPPGPFRVWATFQGGTTGALRQATVPVRAAASGRDALGRARAGHARGIPFLERWTF